MLVADKVIYNLPLIDMDTEERVTLPITIRILIVNQIMHVRDLSRKLTYQPHETEDDQKLYIGLSVMKACADYTLTMLLKARSEAIKHKRRNQ